MSECYHPDWAHRERREREFVRDEEDVRESCAISPRDEEYPVRRDSEHSACLGPHIR